MMGSYVDSGPARPPWRGPKYSDQSARLPRNAAGSLPRNSRSSSRSRMQGLPTGSLQFSARGGKQRCLRTAVPDPSKAYSQRAERIASTDEDALMPLGVWRWPPAPRRASTSLWRPCPDSVGTQSGTGRSVRHATRGPAPKCQPLAGQSGAADQLWVLRVVVRPVLTTVSVMRHFAAHDRRGIPPAEDGECGRRRAKPTSGIASLVRAQSLGWSHVQEPLPTTA